MIQYYHSTSAEHASSQLKGIVYLNPRVSLIHKSHIEIIPTIVISASKHGIERGDSRTRRLMQNLSAHNNQTNKKIDRYSHMRINDIDKFDYIYEGDMERITKDVQLEGIVSLDLSLPYPSSEKDLCNGLTNALCSSLPNALSRVLPNLLEVDLSNNTFFNYTTLREFSKNCHLLEKITCHNIKEDFQLSLDGSKISLSVHLKEIYMDHSFFCYTYTQETDFSDLTNPTLTKYFIFHHSCCKILLERVSIRNAQWCNYRWGNKPSSIPQNALIKFVRNVPSLRWFRSDLTQENRNMLRLERPDMELLN
jgi:hypothetical protein